MTQPSTTPRTSILILDDDRSVRAIVRHAFPAETFELIEFGRISEARKALEKRNVDLMICDGLLPDGTGIDFLRELRKDGKTMAVLFLSSFYKDLATFKQLKDELGVFDVLHKPITPAALEERVSAALSADGKK